MRRVVDRLPIVRFKLEVAPSATEVARLCEQGTPTPAVFLFCFGDATASHRVEDAWSACCEIYLQAQLARQAQLHSFSLNGTKMFNISYVDDAIVCSWSPEHVFAVEQQELVESFETLVEQVLAETSDLRCEQFVQLGASLILAQPQFRTLKEFSGASAAHI